MTALDNYWKNISPLHVFSSGTSTYGLQHPFEIPLIFVGAFFLITMAAPGKWLLVMWFLAAFLPGALSTNQPNALRTLLAAPFFSICSGLGAIEIMTSIEARKRIWYGIVSFGLLFDIFPLCILSIILCGQPDTECAGIRGWIRTDDYLRQKPRISV